jgi:hypothetical protein
LRSFTDDEVANIKVARWGHEEIASRARDALMALREKKSGHFGARIPTCLRHAKPTI